MQSNRASGNKAFSIVSLSRRFNLMPVPAPAGGFLFFACPKKRNQKKRHPDAAFILRPKGFERGFPKGHPSPYKKRDASLHRP